MARRAFLHLGKAHSSRNQQTLARAILGCSGSLNFLTDRAEIEATRAWLSPT